MVLATSKGNTADQNWNNTGKIMTENFSESSSETDISLCF